MTDASTLDGFNPFDPVTLQCPFPHYAAMRAVDPVHEVAGGRSVPRHPPRSRARRGPRSSDVSNQFGGAAMPMSREDTARLIEVFAEGYPRVPTMLTADPPDHTRYRRLVTKAFTPKVIAAMEPAIRGITTRLHGRLARRSARSSSSRSSPSRCRSRSSPGSSTCPIHAWPTSSAGRTTRSPGSARRWTSTARVAAERGVNEFQQYFAEQLELRRTDPRDDVLTDLLNARVDGDDGVADDRPLDLAEMLSIIQQLLVAGNETTTKMLTEMVRLLAEHPDEWRARAGRPGRVDRGGRGDAAPGHADPGDVPHRHQGDDARRCRPPGRGAARRRLRLGQPGRSAVRRPRRRSTRTGTTSRSTSRSARASTSASAQRCPDWRVGSRCRRSSSGSTRSASAEDNELALLPELHAPWPDEPERRADATPRTTDSARG